jgi:hypothetical protein
VRVWDKEVSAEDLQSFESAFTYHSTPSTFRELFLRTDLHDARVFGFTDIRSPLYLLVDVSHVNSHIELLFRHFGYVSVSSFWCESLETQFSHVILLVLVFHG